MGDIFWDLPTWVYYTAGYDLGCIIYIANSTDAEKEYTLISHTYRNGVLISEGAIQVHGYAWFTVDPGDFIRLYGTIRLDESDVILTVSLVEKETQEAIDSVSTVLAAPSAAAMPPGWNIPGTPPVTDWMSLMMTLMIVIMMGKMATSTLEEKEEEEQLTEA